MARRDPQRCSRRGFIGRIAGLAGGCLLPRRATAAPDPLPRARLGRTGLQVSRLGLGSACVGQSEAVTLREAVAVIHACLDEGIDLIDTARGYEKAEQAIGEALRERPEAAVVATKVRAETADEARDSLDASLRALGRERVEIVYLHDIGSMNVDRALGPGGALEYLLERRQAGDVGHVGATAHMRPAALTRAVETGQIDVVMMLVNLVDRHQYGFEEAVLPAARRHDVGVVAMKVLGGLRGSDWRRYYGPNPGPQLDAEHVQLAVRYALAVDGVASAVLGMHTVEQVRANAALVRQAQPLSATEEAVADDLGRRLAPDWGLRFGPAR